MDAVGVPVSLLAASLACCVELYIHDRRTRGAGGAIRLWKRDDDDAAPRLQNGHSSSNGSQRRPLADDDEDVGDDEYDQDDLDGAEKPDELDEGVLIDEESWWIKVRLRKAALTLTLVLLDVIACVNVGWDGMSGAKDKYGIVEDALMIAFWTSLVSLSVINFTKQNLARHWRFTVYLFVLNLLACVSLWSRILIPKSSIGIPTTTISPSDSGPSERHIVSFALTTTTAVLSILAVVLAGTVPRAPSHFFHSPYTLSVRRDLSDSEKPLPNVSRNIEASVLSTLLFAWVTPVLKLGSAKEQMGTDDLPHLSASFRMITLFRRFRDSAKQSVSKHNAKAGPSTSRSVEDAEGPKDGLGYAPKLFNRLLWRIIAVNRFSFTLQCLLSFVASLSYYLPAFFLQKVVAFLERSDEDQSGNKNRVLGYAYCLGLVLVLSFNAVVQQQLWYVSNCMLASRARVQLNSIIFAKTLKRKDVMGATGQGDDSDDTPAATTAPVAAGAKKPTATATAGAGAAAAGDDDTDAASVMSASKESFNSRTQVLNLFSVDCDRVADCAGCAFALIDAPCELIIGTFFLYKLLGYAGLVGIATTILFLPLNHYCSKAFASITDKLMAARDKRVSLMNEVLSSIRYIKFMAYEHAFEARILKARDEEIRQQRKTYMLEVAFNALWSTSPIVCVLVSFWVYTKIMHQALTPSVAFTSLAVFHELEYAINVLPDTFVSALQAYVSLRRIEKYLDQPDVENTGTHEQIVSVSGTTTFADPAPPVAFVNATVTWPSAEEEDEDDSDQHGPMGTRTPASGFRTPGIRKFVMPDISVDFPVGELTLVCGSLGSGKTLLLLALLGEADLLSGQIVCPRSPVDTITVTSDTRRIPEDEWTIPVCAYVPQSAWLLNASIQDNILFGLPLDQSRYQATLEACSLIPDLAILEDGDQTEIGEKGVNLSGGQKARVSLARAVYSRAGYVFLDDVLSAVDAHTAAHIFDNCLCGPLLKGRTVVLVSHHVQLCAAGAKHIVHLDNGSVAFSGSTEEYTKSHFYSKEEQIDDDVLEDKAETKKVVKLTNKNLQHVAQAQPNGSTASSASSMSGIDSSESSDDETEIDNPKEKTAPRKLIEEEGRAVGRVSRNVWTYYLRANGGVIFWSLFVFIFVAAKATTVLDSYWIRVWSNSYDAQGSGQRSVDYYLVVYAIISFALILVDTLQFLILYIGGLQASVHMYKVILRATLRAPLRFFDTMALGRLLNRFGKDFEQIDAHLPDHVGKTTIYALGIVTTLLTVASVSPFFLVAFAAICGAYWYYAKLYQTTAREMRRLDSTTKSPIFSLYGEAIAGVAVIRAFGAPARFMVTQLQRVDKNISFYYYLWLCNCWLSLRFSLLSAFLVGSTGLLLLTVVKGINASIAGFALTFALNISSDMLYMVRRYTALELAMVGVERIKEYTEIVQEPPEIIEPRPPASWPHSGEVNVENLSLRYAPELPRVLHDVSFSVKSGEKVGIVGSTGSGKSSLALSFFRFVEADEGAITIDGLDISKVGLRDLRSRITIVPQDPTILSGTLRSTLDPLEEYEDSEIFDALKRARLLPQDDAPAAELDEVNFNPFRNLETEVSEQGQNFSAGERQLLCLARALLQQHALILMDEATSSVDYETDALITATIAEEFKRSTLLVIAHRLRTVIAFDKILVLDAGRVVEYDAPSKLITDPSTRFHSLCKAAGRREFKILTRLSKKDHPSAAILKRRKNKRSVSGRPEPKNSM